MLFDSTLLITGTYSTMISTLVISGLPVRREFQALPGFVSLIKNFTLIAQYWSVTGAGLSL